MTEPNVIRVTTDWLLKVQPNRYKCHGSQVYGNDAKKLDKMEKRRESIVAALTAAPHTIKELVEITGNNDSAVRSFIRSLKVKVIGKRGKSEIWQLESDRTKHDLSTPDLGSNRLG